MAKKSPQRRWRDIPKDELDADLSRKGKPKAFSKKDAQKRKEDRLRAKDKRKSGAE